MFIAHVGCGKGGVHRTVASQGLARAMWEEHLSSAGPTSSFYTGQVRGPRRTGFPKLTASSTTSPHSCPGGYNRAPVLGLPLTG